MATPIPKVEVPQGLSEPSEKKIAWGSDAIAELLTRLDFRYIALTPGSSFRGLHDSLVNYAGNVNPQLLVSLHEEHAVAIAHGYAKVAEKPMLVALHANVGLQHATMAIYNAWCDRIPMVILGGVGPIDADKRRPWIDWIHTSTDQASLVRPFLKWDDQPGSIPAAFNSLLRAKHIACSKPYGPTYVTLDTTLQESPLSADLVRIPDTHRFCPSSTIGPSLKDLQAVASLLSCSIRPLLLIGHVNRSTQGWADRLALADHLNLTVISDQRQAASFPYPHRRQPAPPRLFLRTDGISLLVSADLIIALNWTDLAGTLKAAFPQTGGVPAAAKIVNCTLDSSIINGCTQDTGAFAPTDILVQCDSDLFVAELRQHCLTEFSPVLATAQWPPAAIAGPNRPEDPERPSAPPYVLQSELEDTLYAVLNSSGYHHTIIRVNIGWNAHQLQLTDPLSFLGYDGGGGVGSGPGCAVGSALALAELARTSGQSHGGTADNRRIPVAVLGDGDVLMGNSALWTAASYRIPLLVVVANNASFYNDEVHQEQVAKTRGRPVENKWIGQRLDDPEPNLSKMAESLGLVTPGAQIQHPEKLLSTLRWAVEEVMAQGKTVLVDVRVKADAYGAAPGGS